jgi:hypothetical protein
MKQAMVAALAEFEQADEQEQRAVLLGVTLGCAGDRECPSIGSATRGGETPDRALGSVLL